MKPEKFVKENEIEFVRLLFPDLTGRVRGKIVPVENFLDIVENGISVAEELITMGMLGTIYYTEGSTSGVESNIMAHPDLRTLTLTPWMKNTAQVMINQVTMKGKPFPRDARNNLKSSFNKLLRKGIIPKIGAELEFYLFKDGKPATNCVEAERMSELTKVEDFMRDIFEYAKIMNIDINTFHHETDEGLFEFSLKYKNALRAADEIFYLKEMINEVGAKLGYEVIMMPKYSKDKNSCGCHLHFSLWNKKRNLFSYNGKETSTLKFAIGGLMKHMEAACAFYLPSVNAYKRLSKKGWTPVNISYGKDNRFASFRITQKNDSTKNIENRVTGMDINPYFAISAMLTSVYLGITKKIEPPKETKGSPYEDKTLEMLPQNPYESLAALESDEEFRNTFGDEVIRLFSKMKRDEYKDFLFTVTEWERKYTF